MSCEPCPRSQADTTQWADPRLARLARSRQCFVPLPQASRRIRAKVSRLQKLIIIELPATYVIARDSVTELAANIHARTSIHHHRVRMLVLRCGQGRQMSAGLHEISSNMSAHLSAYLSRKMWQPHAYLYKHDPGTTIITHENVAYGWGGAYSLLRFFMKAAFVRIRLAVSSSILHDTCMHASKVL